MAVVRVPAGGPGGTPLLIDVDGPVPDGAAGVYDGIATRGNPAERVLDVARDVYADGLDLARHLAEEAARRFAGMAEAARPAEVELQLAIKLDATLGAVVVTTAAEAQLQVTFRWVPGSGAA